MNSIRSAPARPFRRLTPSFRRSTSDRIRFIIGRYAATRNFAVAGVALSATYEGSPGVQLLLGVIRLVGCFRARLESRLSPPFFCRFDVPVKTLQQ